MSADKSSQLLLGLGFKKELSFSNFVSPAELNIPHRLNHLLFDQAVPFLYLVGAKDSGKTHLCSAAYSVAKEKGMNAYFVCGQDVRQTMSGEEFLGYLEFLKEFNFLVVDGIEWFSGDSDFEFALFSLFNHFRDAGNTLVVSACDVPGHLSFSLKDLVSRLSSGMTQKIEVLSDFEKKAAISQYAEQRGISLSDDVLSYIYARSSRSLGALLEVLDKLDHAQLLEKRSITVPFVKKVLGW
ncbi:hypothetical protein A3715_29095 [Oleiphilus sp. HI0009]|uniref:HdaA/DnaA family protein n=1 Tax=unclassified Oleiphilus TaxID=2631174 RepID=UPI0007C2093E|nr:MULTISPECIES: DnaA/Hda family protein [unclassified Oleiphilus]KZX78035.1 hypothetical protein A3715_10915 [Oleiphilus sp. HI0009]KZX84873.1 hypothetical protein A3715_29095 [Oleiphilus sp. HI0009]KZY66158.1 hypothetical protein A3738_07295 [Oleiphilus sp. HI0066]KZY68606.1 hypothetical protein A3739_10765 [Oleiphilus sp. HI0067]KZZ55679.1 hypothetical protein A3762_01530 [Oleiphilus sp. HI0125]